MPSYENLTREELLIQLTRNEAILQDALDERSFIGKQTSMHIKVAELNRLDQDAERFEGRVAEIKALLAKLAA